MVTSQSLPYSLPLGEKKLTSLSTAWKPIISQCSSQSVILFTCTSSWEMLSQASCQPQEQCTGRTGSCVADSGTPTSDQLAFCYSQGEFVIVSFTCFEAWESEHYLRPDSVLQALASWSYMITIKDVVLHLALLFSHENGDICLSQDFESP